VNILVASKLRKKYKRIYNFIFHTNTVVVRVIEIRIIGMVFLFEKEGEFLR